MHHESMWWKLKGKDKEFFPWKENCVELKDSELGQRFAFLNITLILERLLTYAIKDHIPLHFMPFCYNNAFNLEHKNNIYVLRFNRKSS